MAFHHLGMQVADIFSIVRLDASDAFVITALFVMLFAMLGILVCLAVATRRLRISEERDAKRWAERDADRKELSRTLT